MPPFLPVFLRFAILLRLKACPQLPVSGAQWDKCPLDICLFPLRPARRIRPAEENATAKTQNPPRNAVNREHNAAPKPIVPTFVFALQTYAAGQQNIGTVAFF